LLFAAATEAAMNRILISHYAPWSMAEVRELSELAVAMTPIGSIALQLDRTPPAIRAKARHERISLQEGAARLAVGDQVDPGTANNATVARPMAESAASQNTPTGSTRRGGGMSPQRSSSG
jgi:hypothetical protein